jgi:hypothetical protein
MPLNEGAIMFINPLNPFENSCCAEDRYKKSNGYAQQYNAAFNRFKSSIIKGKLFRIVTRVLRRKPFLFDLNEIKSGLSLHGSCYAGIKVVRIRSIIGSEGRVADFDMGFHPLSEAARERWVGMAMAYLSRLPLPPVQLIQIGDAYFVRDGHHRISVARALGQVAIDAEVITWKASPPFPWEPDTAKGSMIVLNRAVNYKSSQKCHPERSEGSLTTGVETLRSQSALPQSDMTFLR